MADALKLLSYLRKRKLPPLDLRPVWQGGAYLETEGKPMAIRRALAFSRVLENLDIVLRADELITGSLEGAYAFKLPKGISKAKAEILAEVTKNIGRRSFTANFDHAAVDYEKILDKGLGGVIGEVGKSMNFKRSKAEIEFLDSVMLTLDAASIFIQRHAGKCRVEARKKKGKGVSALDNMAGICGRIAKEPPQTFEEALQLLWFIFLIFGLEYRGAMALGRFDQYMLPFYKKDIKNRKITKEKALDLILHFWAKLEEPGLVNPVFNICIGGVGENGKDATNELSYICLEATALAQTPRSNLSARFHDNTKNSFYRACAGVIRTGLGFPAVFNDEVLVPALVKKGIALKDARDYCLVGCVETFLPGMQPPWSDSRFNILKCLNLALYNGKDELTGKKSGPKTGALGSFTSYRKMEQAFLNQMDAAVKMAVGVVNEGKKVYAKEKYMDPFLSAFTKDCIKRGRDVNNGGALYPDFHGIAGMGLATTADALSAIKKLVFEEKRFALQELVKALKADFSGYEPLRQELVNHAPKYGNGEPYVDKLAGRISALFCKALHKERTADGGFFLPLMAANVQNISAGKEVGATADGRFSKTPMSDAASPHFGRDKKGPSAVLESISAVDYKAVTGGSVVNMKFSPSLLAGEEGLNRLATLLNVFVKKRCEELQFNVTGSAVMLEAQKNPEAYKNLVVRVSGFSAFFTELGKEVQDDIIGRTEQGSSI